MMLSSLKWFEDNSFEEFRCQHDLFNLFGSGANQWSITEAKLFIDSVKKYWDDW